MKRELGYLVLLILYQNVESIDLVVETKIGTFRGTPATDGDYIMFMGIPYATINSSDPFGPGTPVTHFDDVFNATDESAVCPQFDSAQNLVYGTLDCLNIFIRVPSSARSGNLLPVLAYIHGGGFSSGTGGTRLYGPRYLMRHDIIFVTFNYRIGVYGFMCSQIPELPGNQGLKDQLMALRWINEHIEAFGGDVNQITIGGESAGAMSVDAHLISEKETLFKRAFMLSGTTLTPDVGRIPDVNVPINLAALLGYNTTDLRDALSFLATADPLDVVQASITPNIPAFFPCVEKEFEGIESFLLEHPITKDVPKANGTEILIGFTSHECIACGGGPKPTHVDEIGDYLLLNTEFNFTEQEMEKMVYYMTKFYIGDEGPELGFDAQMKFVDYETDYKFVWPAERSIDKYLENGANSVYYYQFSYDGGRNMMKIVAHLDLPGAIHADDVGYIFHVTPTVMDVVDPPLPEDQLIIDRHTTMLTNFVKYGNPTPEITELLPIKWEPITRGSPHYNLNIDTELSIQRKPHHNRTAFWNLFYRHNWKSHIGNPINLL